MRPVTEADLPALAAFFADDEERLLGRPSRTGPNDVRAWMSRASYEQDSWVLDDGEGRPAAVGWVEGHDAVGVAVGVVRADVQGRGVGTMLVERAEARLRELGAARVHQIAFAADLPASRLFAVRGYHEVRRFWEMTVELDGAPSVPALPEGLRIERLDERDARRFHQALDEAFRDHWEHVPRPFDEWWEERRAAPDFDPTLWFVVRDGDEVAAAVLGEPNRNGGGWVAALGVRRPWRGRGLGKALLLRTFAEFHRRGVSRVSLGVDAENPTGATALYERVGMVTELEQVVFERGLT